jgi:hypothetical protein
MNPGRLHYFVNECDFAILYQWLQLNMVQFDEMFEAKLLI